MEQWLGELLWWRWEALREGSLRARHVVHQHVLRRALVVLDKVPPSAVKVEDVKGQRDGEGRSGEPFKPSGGGQPQRFRADPCLLTDVVSWAMSCLACSTAAGEVSWLKK